MFFNALSDSREKIFFSIFQKKYAKKIEIFVNFGEKIDFLTKFSRKIEKNIFSRESLKALKNTSTAQLWALERALIPF